jgi:hypothetical protein
MEGKKKRRNEERMVVRNKGEKGGKSKEGREDWKDESSK